MLAVRGLGGFHLAVDATREAAVAGCAGASGARRSRSRSWCGPWPRRGRWREVNEAEAALLCSPERPVVLLRRRGPVRLAPSPSRRGSTRVGVMLAYTPLHHLLLDLVAGRW